MQKYVHAAACIIFERIGSIINRMNSIWNIRTRFWYEIWPVISQAILKIGMPLNFQRNIFQRATRNSHAVFSVVLMNTCMDNRRKRASCFRRRSQRSRGKSQSTIAIRFSEEWYIHCSVLDFSADTCLKEHALEVSVLICFEARY